MATVYLPLGYPIIGESFQNVIFQGTMARLYTGTNDPRVANQIFERKLLSDVAKMRGAAGKWAKSAWKLSYGSKYTQIIHQMVRGDVAGYWTSAGDQFDNFSTAQREAWRDAAPYQVTFNDPGKIFFSLMWMLYEWDDANQGHLYYQPAPGAENSAECATWWTAALEDFGFQLTPPFGWNDDDVASSWHWVGNWEHLQATGHYGGTISRTNRPGDYAEMTVRASWFRYIYPIYGNGAVVKVYVDGQQAAILNQAGTLQYQRIWNDNYRAGAVHTWRIVHSGTAGKYGQVDAAFMNVNYWFTDLDMVSANWQISDDIAPDVYQHYESTGAGVEFVEFNFVGSWLYLNYSTRSTYGEMDVFIDGEHIKTINQYSLSVGTGADGLIGRVKFGLHRARFVKKGAGQINFGSLLVLRSKREMVA